MLSIINGTPLTLSTDRRAVWDRLQDPHYNIATAAYLTIYNAHQVGLEQVELDRQNAHNGGQG